MARMIILTEADLRSIVTLDLERRRLRRGRLPGAGDRKPVAMPPILRLDIPEHRGEVDVKTAYVPGLDGFAIKISPGFFDNPKLGLPSVNGLMVLLSAKTGLVEALLLDNGYLTDVRTAAAGAVAAKILSRPDAAMRRDLRRGHPGAAAARSADAGAPDREARIWARDAGKAAKPPGDCDGAASAFRSRAAADRRERPCAGADIIVTTTPAETPILDADWLQPGPARHRHGLGRRAQERDRPGARRPRRPLCRRQPRADAPRSANCITPSRPGSSRRPADFAELGQVIAGQAPGRTRGLTRSPSATSPAPASRTPPSPRLPRQRAASAGAGTAIRKLNDADAGRNADETTSPT